MAAAWMMVQLFEPLIDLVVECLLVHEHLVLIACQSTLDLRLNCELKLFIEVHRRLGFLIVYLSCEGASYDHISVVVINLSLFL